MTFVLAFCVCFTLSVATTLAFAAYKVVSELVDLLGWSTLMSLVQAYIGKVWEHGCRFCGRLKHDMSVESGRGPLCLDHHLLPRNPGTENTRWQKPNRVHETSQTCWCNPFVCCNKCFSSLPCSHGGDRVCVVSHRPGPEARLSPVLARP